MKKLLFCLVIVVNLFCKENLIGFKGFKWGVNAVKVLNYYQDKGIDVEFDQSDKSITIIDTLLNRDTITIYWFNDDNNLIKVSGYLYNKNPKDIYEYREGQSLFSGFKNDSIVYYDKELRKSLNEKYNIKSESTNIAVNRLKRYEVAYELFSEETAVYLSFNSFFLEDSPYTMYMFLFRTVDEYKKEEKKINDDKKSDI